GGPSGAGQPEDRGGGGRAGGPPAALQGEGGDGHEGGQEPQPDVEPGDVVVAQAPAGRRRAGQPDAGRGGGGQPAGGGGVDGGHHRRHRGGGRLRRRRDRQGQVGRRRRRRAAQRRRLAHRRFDDRFGRHRPGVGRRARRPGRRGRRRRRRARPGALAAGRQSVEQRIAGRLGLALDGGADPADDEGDLLLALAVVDDLGDLHAGRLDGVLAALGRQDLDGDAGLLQGVEQRLGVTGGL